MSINEVTVDSTDIAPIEICTHVNNSYVDLCVDSTYEVTGYKREYAIVGDAYFAQVTPGDTPAWMVDLINDIINSSLSTVFFDIEELKGSILESLRELDIAKNQYQELINIEATIDSIISSRLATINASIDNSNAEIIELWMAKVSAEQAAAIAVNQISSELNSPTGSLYGAITNIRTTVTNLNGELDAKYADLYNLNENMGFSLAFEINRVEASIEDVATALIESMDLALATDVLALAQRVTDLTATVDQNQASINVSLNALTNELGSQASSITTLRADMNSEFASVEAGMSAFATSLGGIGARYGVKLTAGGVNPSGVVTSLVGGFELLNTGAVVSAGFDVDQFWVGRVGVNGKRPFIIDAGIVYIDTAVIKTASIDFAKISDTLQSTNYVANTSGWGVFKNGYAEFQNIKARGDIQASSLTANLVVTNAIRSSNFNVASPASSPGWGIFEDGRAYFANPVISRPNIVASGTFIGPFPDGYIKDTNWSGGGDVGPIVNTFQVDDGSGNFTTHYLRDMTFFIDVPRSSYVPANVGNISGKLLTAQAFVTGTSYYYTGADPGSGGVSVYDTIAEAQITRVSQFTSGEGGSYIRIKVVCPLPLNIHSRVYRIEYNSLIWSLSEFS